MNGCSLKASSAVSSLHRKHQVLCCKQMLAVSPAEDMAAITDCRQPAARTIRAQPKIRSQGTCAGGAVPRARLLRVRGEQQQTAPRPGPFLFIQVVFGLKGIRRRHRAPQTKGQKFGQNCSIHSGPLVCLTFVHGCRTFSGSRKLYALCHGEGQ